HRPAFRSHPGRQRRQHPDAGIARRQVRRHRAGRLGDVPHGRRSHRVHPVGAGAREPREPALREPREPGPGGERQQLRQERGQRGQGFEAEAGGRRMKVFTAGLATLVLAAGAAYAATEAADESPSELVQRVAEAMLKDLDANRAEYRQNPAKVGELVEKHLLPHFDTRYAAQRVLGKHWRNATEEQRERFIDAFYQSMLKNYGSALAEFTGDRLKVFPSKVGADDKIAIVRTEVKRSNGTSVP